MVTGRRRDREGYSKRPFRDNAERARTPVPVLCAIRVLSGAVRFGDDALRMSTSDPRRTHYKVLMLAETADAEIITVVYRKLAQRFHPDVDSGLEAATRMKEINAAYAVLRDPQQRSKYDAWLASRRDRRQGDRPARDVGEVAYGEAGAPVGPPQGSKVDFGRYSGWTLGQIKRADPQFLEWLMHVPAGRSMKEEISRLLGHR